MVVCSLTKIADFGSKDAEDESEGNATQAPLMHVPATSEVVVHNEPLEILHEGGAPPVQEEVLVSWHVGQEGQVWDKSAYEHVQSGQAPEAHVFVHEVAKSLMKQPPLILWK